MGGLRRGCCVNDITAWAAANLTPELFREFVGRFGGAEHYVQSLDALNLPARNLSMVQARERGDSYATIAARHNVSVDTVRRVVDHPKAA